MTSELDLADRFIMWCKKIMHKHEYRGFDGCHKITILTPATYPGQVSIIGENGSDIFICKKCGKLK